MSQKFTPFIAKTSSIPELIVKTAKENNISPANVDFDVLKVTAGIKLPGKEKFIPVNDKVKEKLNDEKFVMQRRLEIKESYEVNMRPKISNEPIVLHMEVTVDKFKTRASALFKRTSSITNTADLYENLVAEVNKKKLRLGMLISVRNEAMLKVIKEDIVPGVLEHGILDHDVDLPLTEWIAPTPTVNDKLIFHKGKKRVLEDGDGKIDYADRGFVKEVQKGDLIVEYRVPVKGTNGRSYNGTYLSVAKPKENYKDTFTYDTDSVEKVPKENGGVEYYAKRDGFIQIASKELKIGDELEVDSINFKDTGHVVTDLDKNITIKTFGKKGKDDIGDNMKVETTNIEVGGNVGSHAEIKAVNVTVKGQTHQSSKIFCTKGTINHLRGEIKGTEVRVESLEGGVVYADKVSIGYCQGGRVYAKEIFIETLDKNNMLKATSKVHIQSMEETGDNMIILDPNATEEDKIRIKKLIAQRTNLDNERKMSYRKLEAINNVISRNQTSVANIKEQIEKETKAGRTPKKIFVDKYAMHIRDLKKAKELGEAYNNLDLKVKNKNIQISRVQSDVLKASVMNDDLWHGFNKIIFKTIVPARDFELIPHDKSKTSDIRLVQKNLDDANDGFEVKAMIHELPPEEEGEESK